MLLIMSLDLEQAKPLFFRSILSILCSWLFPVHFFWSWLVRFQNRTPCVSSEGGGQAPTDKAATVKPCWGQIMCQRPSKSAVQDPRTWESEYGSPLQRHSASVNACGHFHFLVMLAITKAISLAHKPPIGRFVKELEPLTLKKKKKTQITQLLNFAGS